MTAATSAENEQRTRDNAGRVPADGESADSVLAVRVPGMTPRSTLRNFAVGAGYLLVLTALATALANVAISYRPVRGC